MNGAISNRAFTLIETLIATLVLVTGLAAIAGLFSQGAQVNIRNRQRSAAATLLASRMDEVRRDPSPLAGQSAEYLSLQPDGTATPEDISKATYLRTSTVLDGDPQRITVIVYGRVPGRGKTFVELARATTLLADGF